MEIQQPEETALADMLQRLPSVFSCAVAQLQEDRKLALEMHMHYRNLAQNNQDVALPTDSDKMAREYIDEVIRADSEISSLAKAVATVAQRAVAARAKKPSVKSANANMIVAQPGAEVNIFGEKSRREILEEKERQRREKANK